MTEFAFSDVEEEVQTEYEASWHSPTVVPTEVPSSPPEEPLLTLDTSIEDANLAAARSHELRESFEAARAELKAAALVGEGAVEPALERKMRILAVEADAAYLRLTYARLLLACPPTWRSSAQRLDAQNRLLIDGYSRKADTKPKRVLMRLAQLYSLLTQMSAHGLDNITASSRLDFDPKWLEHPCWFVKQTADGTGNLDFHRFDCPGKPHLASIEINIDYASGADKINICMPAGKDRREAWDNTIQWVRQIMNLSKATALRQLADLQVPHGFDINYTNAALFPCVVWIGEAPRKDQGPRAQPSHRPGPYGMPASSSHQYHGGQGVWWWQEQMPPAGPSWQDCWQGQWYQGQWSSGHR